MRNWWTVFSLVVALLSSGARGMGQADPSEQLGRVRTVAASRAGSEVAGAKWARLESVNAVQGKHGITVQIRIIPTVRPAITMLSDPDRLVLDFPGTILTALQNHIAVNRDGVAAIRLGIQPVQPPLTRLVLDLTRPRSYQLAVTNGQVSVDLGSQSPIPQNLTYEAGKAAPALVANASSPAELGSDADSARDLHERYGSEAPSLKAAVPAQPPSSGSATVAQDMPGNSEAKTETSQQAGGPDPDPPASSRRTGEPVSLSTLDGSPVSEGVANSRAIENLAPSPLPPSAETQETVLQVRPSTTSQDTVRAQGDTPADQNIAAPVSPGTGSATSASVANLSSAASDLRTQVKQPHPLDLKEPANTNAYVIGEQDQLAISVWGEPELTVPMATVRPDGKITVPLVNEVKVSGLTPTQLQDLLTEKLKPFVKAPQVSVIVRRISSRKVYLIGETFKTGTFTINSSTTVLQLIAEAGGLKDFAKRKGIYVLRNEQGKQVRHKFNYDQVIRGQHNEQNIVLQPEDTVVVP